MGVQKEGWQGLGVRGSRVESGVLYCRFHAIRLQVYGRIAQYRFALKKWLGRLGTATVSKKCLGQLVLQVSCRDMHKDGHH